MITKKNGAVFIVVIISLLGCISKKYKYSRSVSIGLRHAKKNGVNTEKYMEIKIKETRKGVILIFDKENKLKSDESIFVYVAIEPEKKWKIKKDDCILWKGKNYNDIPFNSANNFSNY